MTYWYFLAAAIACAGVAAGLFALANHIDHGDVIAFMLGVAFAFAACVSGGIFIGENFDRYQCLEQGAKTGITVQYQLLIGCYVRIDGNLVPYDRWVQVSGVNAP